MAKTKTPKAPKPAPPVTARMSSTYVKGEGPVPCRVALFGENPGKRDDWKGRPFIGPPGELLTSMLELGGLWRSDLYLSYIVKRRITDHAGNDDTPTQAEIDYFKKDLLIELAQVNADLYIACGSVAARTFCPEANMELHHGLVLYSTILEAPVIVAYHPASGLHDTDNMQAIYWDYEQVGKFVRGEVGVHEAKPRRTRIMPTAEMPLNLDDGATVGLDTEWKTNHDPWCITVSCRDGEAFFIRPDDRFAIEKLNNWARDPEVTFYIHNAMADIGPCKSMGLDLYDGLFWDGTRARVVDTMVLAFQQGRIHTQGLKTLAYRLLKIQMGSYDDLVGPVAQQLALEYLLDAAGREWIKPEPMARWNEELNKVTVGRPQGMGQRINRILSDYGQWLDGTYKHQANGVDLVKRWDGIDWDRRDEVHQVLGQMPEADLSHCEFEAASHYACQDADVTRLLGPVLEAKHLARDLITIAIVDHGQLPLVEVMQATGLPADPAYFHDLGLDMQRMQEEIAKELSEVVGWNVNPKSSDQVAQLLYEQLGLEPLKLTKSGKASTGKKALQHLRDENPIVQMILQSREYAKIDDAFCGNIIERSREVGGEWRAFYQLLVTRVKTGRLAAKNFNALAIPVRTKLGVRLRKGFRCRPGRLLGTWDLSQIEMRVMAHDSRDPLMLDIYNRDPRKYPKWLRDLHIETACRVFGGTPSEAWLHDEDKDQQRTACKSTGFGILMGITEKGLADQMRLYGLDPEVWTEDECLRLKTEWLKVYEGVDGYQMTRKAEARRLGYVTDLYGRRFDLPHVNCPLRWIAEEAERQAHALPIQSAAQAIEKMAMARCYRELMPIIQPLGYCQPLLQVHDELIWEFDAELEPVIDAEMMHILTTTADLLVPIEAGMATGESWGDL